MTFIYGEGIWRYGLNFVNSQSKETILSKMIESASLTNYGPITSLNVNNLGHINLLIGPNRSGKTFFLKALYSALRTIELYRRGKNIENDKEILFRKLYWTFQTDKIGNIVRRPDKGVCLSRLPKMMAARSAIHSASLPKNRL